MTETSKNIAPKKNVLFQGLRKIIGFVVGSAFAGSTLVCVVLTVTILTGEIDIGTNQDTVTPAILMTILTIISFGLSVAGFRFIGRVAAVNGCLYSSYIFLGTLIYSFLDGSAAEHRLPIIMTFSILAIFYLTLCAIFYRRAKADNIPDLPFDKFPYTARSDVSDIMIRSKLADKVQTPFKRRSIVTLYGLVLLAIAALYITYNSASAAALGGAIPGLTIGLMLIMIVLEELLRVCLKPIIGENLDERQIDLIQSANADSRIANLALIAILGIITISPLDVHIKGAVAGLAIAFAFLMPRFILAYGLPEETGEDLEGDEALMTKQWGA